MLDHLLVFRMTIFNALAAAGVVWAYQMGFVTDMFGNDDSYMTYVSSVLLFVGVLGSFSRARKVSATLDKLKRGVTPELNGAKFLEKSAYLDDISEYIVVVGLLGTAIGVVMMLSQFSVDNLSDPTKSITTVLMASEGLGTAFRSTIVSIIAWLWFRPNLRMVKTATVMMIEDSQ